MEMAEKTIVDMKIGGIKGDIKCFFVIFCYFYTVYKVIKSDVYVKHAQSAKTALNTSVFSSDFLLEMTSD